MHTLPYRTTHGLTLQTPSEMRQSLVKAPHAFPGGYPKYAVLADGEALCHHCADSEAEHLDDADHGDDWRIVGIEINYEDTDLYCCHCGEQIESAYGDAYDDREEFPDQYDQQCPDTDIDFYPNNT